MQKQLALPHGGHDVAYLNKTMLMVYGYGCKFWY